MSGKISRRGLLVAAGAAAAAGASGTQGTAVAAAGATRAADFRFCLNTATLMGFKLSITEEIEIVAKTGYSGFEPWLRSIEQYTAAGKSLKDLRKLIADRGLTVEGAIGFASWIIDDPAERAKGLEQMKRDMDAIAQIGGTRIAAAPAGAYDKSGLDPRVMGQRYRAVLEMGRQMGVRPQLEIWGSSKTLSRISEAAAVAIETGHPDACLLLDVYHIYRGGSSFDGLRLLSGQAMHVLHVNDYPANPPREKATDADRIFPGDGVAPWQTIMENLRAVGFRGALSLELFNRDYWKRDPLEVAKTGLAKVKGVVERFPD